MFVYTRNKPEFVSIAEGNNHFEVALQKPGFDSLLELYQKYGKEIEQLGSVESTEIPVALARSLRDLFIENAVDWRNVADENGTMIPFNKRILTSIINDSPACFMKALTAINNLLAREGEREKNADASSSSA